MAGDDGRGPGRREIQWKDEYREVVEPKRLVFTLSDQPGEDDYELVTVVLTDLGDGRTEMLFQRRGGLSAEQYERGEQGWSSFFDRMDQAPHRRLTAARPARRAHKPRGLPSGGRLGSAIAQRRRLTVTVTTSSFSNQGSGNNLIYSVAVTVRSSSSLWWLGGQHVAP